MALLNTRAVAKRLGVSVHTLRQWRYNREYLEFPEPDIKGEDAWDSPYWEWKTVERWAKQHRPELLKGQSSSSI